MQRKVLVHVGDNEKAAEFAAYGDGVVLHGAAGLKLAPALPPGTMRLIDRERYAGDRGSHQPQLFPETPEDAVELQLRAGATCLLAPSGFPVDRSDRSIRAALATGREFVEASREMAPTKPVYVPIVVRYDELADRRWIRPVGEAGVPIATIFAARGDPLETAEQLRGAIELLQAADEAMVLRCDLSAAGLMAHGAGAGAIGASSSVRHLWLPSKSSSEKKRTRSRSVFVPSAANWMKVRFVEQAAADPDLDEVFRCDCVVCGPEGDVRRLASADAHLQDLHSVAASVTMARRVTTSASPLTEWHFVCHRADETYTNLRDLGIIGPTRPGALTAWLEILG